MVFVYIRIYFAAKARARRGIKKKPNKQQSQVSVVTQSHTNPLCACGICAAVSLSPFPSTRHGSVLLVSLYQAAHFNEMFFGETAPHRTAHTYTRYLLCACAENGAVKKVDWTVTVCCAVCGAAAAGMEVYPFGVSHTVLPLAQTHISALHTRTHAHTEKHPLGRINSRRPCCTCARENGSTTQQTRVQFNGFNAPRLYIHRRRWAERAEGFLGVGAHTVRSLHNTKKHHSLQCGAVTVEKPAYARQQTTLFLLGRARRGRSRRRCAHGINK